MPRDEIRDHDRERDCPRHDDVTRPRRGESTLAVFHDDENFHYEHREREPGVRAELSRAQIR